MVNSTVNSKKTGKAAGKDDKTIITGMGIRKNSRELEAEGKIFIDTAPLRAGEFISIKAYPGGKPQNKEKKEEFIH